MSASAARLSDDLRVIGDVTRGLAARPSGLVARVAAAGVVLLVAGWSPHRAAPVRRTGPTGPRGRFVPILRQGLRGPDLVAIVVLVGLILPVTA